MTSSQATTDHYTIRRWIEERGGKPASSRAADGQAARVLRVVFPDAGDEQLQHLGWGEFFEKFDRMNLAFLYEDRLESGELSRVCEFVDRKTVREHAERY